ncbi:MAG: hypothetical protein IBJ11_10490 [Phycisphaerales bacterium]|nr:hypothetical protein [Phycisphaerales bacterium]
MDVSIVADGRVLPGELCVPAGAGGLVLFAHGSGSGRQSPRNRLVAGVLQGAGLGTLLFDLLTEAESEDRRNVFDIGLLADRLLAAAGWAMGREEAGGLPVGLFGASTGAGAALVAAAREPRVRAVVSRGGRPDLAGAWLAEVRAPTLLIVGAWDREVLELNRAALGELRCEKRLSIVPGATHLFEEPGTLERAAGLARGWFIGHMLAGGAR